MSGLFAYRSPARFWQYHLIGPLAAFAISILVIEWIHFDLVLADWVYRFEGGRWALKDHFMTSIVLHDAAQKI